MVRVLRNAVVLVALCAGPAWALQPGLRISQYPHIAWRAREGAFHGTPSVVVQDRGGYIWVATATGLLRFDGATFAPAPAALQQALPTTSIACLMAGRDGSLWVATRGALIRWKDEKVTTYPTPGVTAGGIFEDRRGTVWVTLIVHFAGRGPLCRVEGVTFQCLEESADVPDLNSAVAFAEDADGSLWVGGDLALLRWNNGWHTEVRPAGLANNMSQFGVSSVTVTPTGDIWVGFRKTGPGYGLQRLVGGRLTPFEAPGFDGTTLDVSVVRLDRHGALWVGTNDRGVFRISGADVDHFDKASGLSGDSVNDLSWDHEGNLWVATTDGLDRFSDTSVVSFGPTEGLCSHELDSVLATRDGAVWVGGDRALSRLKDGRIQCIRSGSGLPGTQVTSMLEDHLGRLWVGLDATLWVYADGRFQRITKPDGSDLGLVSGLDEDRTGSVWAAVVGSPRHLLRIDDMVVREDVHDGSRYRRVVADPTGGVWVGMFDGDLAHYRDGHLELHRFAHDDSAAVNQLLAREDGSVLGATTYGLIGWHDGKPATLTSKNGLPCRSVNAMTFDEAGDLWLYMDCALGRVPKIEVERWLRNPDSKVSIDRPTEFDGIQAIRAPFVAAARSSDGRLWLVNTISLSAFDPRRPVRNSVVPPVYVEEVVADQTHHGARTTIELPPHTRNVEIHYVGLSFTAPQKMQFRYRLDGVDDTWQDVGTRRQAFYNDLGPGRYRFRVIASNNDGVWNNAGATIDMVVAPAWYQTRASWALFGLGGFLALAAVYQLRIRQVAGALKVRFDERLAERTRVAREIHDTLLQTIQGTRMVAEASLKDPSDITVLREAMERVCTWLGQATDEGRKAVGDLRASTTETNELADALRRASEEFIPQTFLDAEVSVAGASRHLHPVVRDEVYRIAYEAIRNAFVHSGGTHLKTDLVYGTDLVVRIADDGIGIDPVVADGGRHGHFGMTGMRERAERIGAKLTITTAAPTGTEITIVVPGRVAYRET